ncbi:hypothetical protein [Anabaena lutea]|uniref:Uncharacterized protein n=1 Tax=Anabaena lutea FACHB-196 TaxID=2692881 RepID=A0ABR8FIU3_9NOST|nr:hypothetical protein [Anabaena lutea]MBD2569699.1 hypothetical protein [Anabaena lutea FACHB-196]
MSTLFNLDEYTSLPETPRLIDPTWDEIVLDCSGKVESNGQATLFYDSSSEPPDPDDYETPYDFQQAWDKWEKQFPEIAEEIKFKFKVGQKVAVLKSDSKYFGAITTVKKILRCSVQTELRGTAGVFHWSELELIKDVEQEFLEESDQDFVDDVLEKPVKGFHFEEGKAYWHSSRNCKFKITRLLASVSKAQGYFAGEIVKEKILLCELSPLLEISTSPSLLKDCATKVSTSSSPSLLKDCATKVSTSSSPTELGAESDEVTTLPEQVNSVLEKSTINQWVERYYVTRSGKKYWYDRYCYYQKKIKHIHIPGSDGLKERVENAIALGHLPEQIQQLIKSA